MALGAVLAGVLWVAVSATGGDGPPAGAPVAPPELAPAPGTAAPGELLRFDELPAPAPPEEDRRVQRFLGALAGGAVGFAAPLTLLPLAESGCLGLGCGPSGAQLALASVVPVTTALGAWLGFLATGGDGGPLTPLASLLPGAVAGLLLFTFATAAEQGGSMLQLMPFLLTTGAVTAASAALALDARARQLGGLGGARGFGVAPPARVLLTSLLSLLTVGVGGLTTGAVVSACRDAVCGVAALGLLGVSSAVGAALAAWGVHHAMGGRGSALASLLSLGLVAAAALVGVPLVALVTSAFGANGLTAPAVALTAAQFAVGATLFFPTLALEWSHAEAIGALASKVSLGAAPTPGGGTVVAALRF